MSGSGSAVTTANLAWHHGGFIIPRILNPGTMSVFLTELSFFLPFCSTLFDANLGIMIDSQIRIKGSGLSNTVSGSTFEASIVLPSFNRKDTLKRVLHSLEGQTVEKNRYEVIVSDDGSTDGTATFLENFSNSTPCKFRFILASENGGPARARNLALRETRGKIIIIIGDDIEVATCFVEQHLSWHSRHKDRKEAVLGYVTWPDALNTSLFMRWLEKGGRAFFFRFADFQSGEQVGCQCFYTCNVSIKRDFLFQTNLFDESFPFASHEDLELGERLRLLGMKLYYDQNIRGDHWHLLNVNGIAQRVYLIGYSAPMYWQKVTDTSSKTKQVCRRLLARFMSLPFWWKFFSGLLNGEDLDNRQLPCQWMLILTLSYWIGFADGARGHAVRVFPDYEVN